ncbi:MAG: methyltransferase domain-containing protein [Candidatus Dormibacteria bacterium]
MAAPDTYVLEPSTEELDRLLFVSNHLAPAVRETCTRAGLGRGGRALDVGCGPIGALQTLAGIVGPEGSVVGIEADPLALDRAGRAVQRAGLSNVRLVHGDANELTPEMAGGANFDLAFCRLVLMHQTDPAATMARIATMLRPGGVLVAIDFFAPPILEPAQPAVDRAWELVIGAMRARKASPQAARRYRALCARAGLEVISERGVFSPVPAAAMVSEAAVLLQGVRSTVETSGLASAAEVAEVLTALQAGALPDGTVAYSPQTIELVARIPTATAGADGQRG